MLRIVAGVAALAAVALPNARAVAAQVSTYAGSGVSGIADGPAAQAQFIAPFGVAWGSGGRLYVTDAEAQRIRVVLPDGTVKTVAGSGAVAPTGLAVEGGYADGPGATARFNLPTGIVVDAGGRVLVADTGNRCIRAIDPSGNVTTIAGDPRRSGARDGPRGVASFDHPTGIALGLLGSLFVADGNAGVRVIAPDGTVSTLPVAFGPAFGIASWLGGDGALYVTSRDGLWSIDLTVLSAGRPGAVSRFRPGMPTLEPPLQSTAINELSARGQHAVGVPFGVAAFDGVAVAYTDVITHRVRYADPLRQDVDVIGGGSVEDAADEGGYADGPTRQSRFDEPTGVAVAPDGTVAVADSGNKRIRLIRGVDRRGPIEASSGGLTAVERRPNEYRIGFVGGSMTWGSGPFEVSPAAAIEHRLAADGALAHVGKTARVVTVDAGSDVAALRSYVDLITDARPFDCVVIMVTDWDPGLSYPDIVGNQPLVASATRWVPRLTKDLAEVKRALDAAGIPSLFVAVPVASELGTTVFAAAQIVPHRWLGAGEVASPDGSLERLATTPLANAKLNWLNTWDLIERDMRSANHPPLYLSLDGHFTTYGNQLLGDAIGVRLEIDRPWSTAAK
jgi:DNA-binding beta-propeller fold protein YncE